MGANTAEQIPPAPPGKPGGASISRRLTLSLALVIFLVVALLYASFYLWESSRMRRELEIKADEEISTMVGMLTLPLWTLDVSGIKQICAAYMQNELFALLRVVDYRWGVVFEEERLSPGEERIHRSRTMQHQGEVIGHVEISVRVGPLEKELRVLSLTIVLTLLSSLVVVILGTGLLLNRWLRRPLSVLQKWMEQVAAGSYAYDPRAIHERELLPIAGIFGKMALEVRARETALQNANLRLEKEISDRKHSEQALRLSEEKFSKAFWNSPTWVVISSLEDGRYLEVNQTFLGTTGYSREEVIGHTSAELGVWADPGDRERIVREVKRKGSVRNVEVRTRAKSGELRAMLFSGEAIRVGEEDCLLSVSLDITELKLVDEALRRSEEGFRSLVEKSPLGVSLIGKDGRYRYLNPKFTEIFGYILEEIPTGREWFEKAYPDPEARRESIAHWKEDFKGLKAGEVWHRSYEVVCKDGSSKTILFRPVKMESGDYIMIYEDITEQKRLEAQFQHAQRMEAVGTLAGGIAHDFNNLLMGIQGRASLLLMDISPSHPHFEHLRGIEEYVKSAADLTKQLLGFARRGKYETRPGDLNAVVAKAAHMFGRTKKEIRIHEKFQEGLWTVEFDLGQMEQVLLNLYVNAWQAMPGGGDLYLQTENVILDEAYMRAHQLAPGRYVKVSVTDSGVGMDRKTLQRLFEPFFTTKEMGRGTGLGLASVYGIIQNHGGIINAYSEKGAGSTFNIYLPASGKSIPEKTEEQAEVMRGSETVLLVDDEQMILEVGKEMLGRIGYAVLVAGTGTEAVDLYRNAERRIDLVILDMIMPDLGGGPTYDRLKALDPGVKVLLSSGYSINGQAQEILNRGCDGFIQKPFNLTDLSSRIRAILDKPRRE